MLPCHVRLRRTSRFRFGCISGCEHSKIGFILIVPSAQVLESRPPCIYSGRAGLRARICSALSCDMFARVVWLRLRRARDSRLSLCHLPHALATHYFLRLTRARGVSSQREGNALFDDFWYFSSLKSTIKEKWLYLKKTPHPSAYGCHLLPQSRRRRPRLLRKSVNSPLEKAGKMS